MQLSTNTKPVINITQLRYVAAEYLQVRGLGFTRAATESHLCNLLLTDRTLVEEVTAVLTSTAENPALPVSLTVSR